MNSVPRPSTSHAARHPFARINACATGGDVMLDSAAPASINPSARPRSASNHPKIARDDAIGDAPIVAKPMTAKTSRRCQSAGHSVDSAESDATAQPDKARQGMMTRLAPNRSSSLPIHGAENAATSVRVPNADAAASLDQEKSSDTGRRNTANVLSGTVAKNV